MSHETRKYLYDVQQAVTHVLKFIEHKQFADYAGDAMLRSAVERQCEIIGEALNQLKQRDPNTLGQIRGYRQAIAFRNILIHGYANIDDEIVWRVVQDDLPALRDDIARLLPGSNG